MQTASAFRKEVKLVNQTLFFLVSDTLASPSFKAIFFQGAFLD